MAKIRLIKYYLIAFLFIAICLKTSAQYQPIKILNNHQTYNYRDTLDIVINNNDDSTYYVTVGLEKYSEYSLWEEITGNVLLKKTDINGETKGGLSYYLTPLGHIKVNRVINQINIPFLINPDKMEYEPTKKYRISTTSETVPNKIMLGTFRLSIKISREMKPKEYMIIKSNPFDIIN